MTPEQKRDSEMERVETRAEKEDTWDTDAVATFVVQYLKKNGAHSSEDITDAAKQAGHIPHDDRAFGPVYSRLSRSNAIVAKAANSRRRKGNATRGGYIWEAA